MNLNYRRQAPPGRPPHELAYAVDGDRLTITHRAGEQTTVDTFDFTDAPDGQLDVATIQTRLPVQPILAAKRIDGQLTVTVLDWRRA